MLIISEWESFITSPWIFKNGGEWALRGYEIDDLTDWDEFEDLWVCEFSIFIYYPPNLAEADKIFLSDFMPVSLDNDLFPIAYYTTLGYILKFKLFYNYDGS